MERLTEWFDDGILEGVLVKEEYGEQAQKTLFEEVDEGYLGMCVLKTYEDTGLSVSDIQILKERLSRENTPEITISSRDNDGWIPVEERLPEEKINHFTKDFYEYQVTANFGFGEDVRTYKYGNGHWWHGPGIVDEYVLAWRPLPEPYLPERSHDEKE